MIQIKIEQLNDVTAWNEWKKWLQECTIKTRELIERVQRGEKPEFDNKLYRRKKDYFFSIEGPFNGKCAYCESQIIDGRNADIDHYRPKALVTDEKDKPVTIRFDDGHTDTHPGYYWLAYEWHNLLPACKYCNQLTKLKYSTVGKKNRFPIRGNYAMHPGEERSEQPLLLHPVFDDPSEHFEVDLDNGLLNHRSERGEATIRILGLNLRDRLPENRKSAIDRAMALTMKLMTDKENQKKVKDELDKIKLGKTEYSLAAQAFLRDFRKRFDE